VSEVQKNEIEAVRRALSDFTKYDASHSDDCPHRYCDEAPCPGDADCEVDDDAGPCSTDDCFAEAADRLTVAVRALLTSLGAT
jgi:hypothetical protein